MKLFQTLLLGLFAATLVVSSAPTQEKKDNKKDEKKKDEKKPEPKKDDPKEKVRFLIATPEPNEKKKVTVKQTIKTEFTVAAKGKKLEEGATHEETEQWEFVYTDVIKSIDKDKTPVQILREYHKATVLRPKKEALSLPIEKETVEIWRPLSAFTFKVKGKQQDRLVEEVDEEFARRLDNEFNTTFNLLSLVLPSEPVKVDAPWRIDRVPLATALQGTVPRPGIKEEEELYRLDGAVTAKGHRVKPDNDKKGPVAKFQADLTVPIKYVTDWKPPKGKPNVGTLSVVLTGEGTIKGPEQQQTAELTALKCVTTFDVSGIVEDHNVRLKVTTTETRRIAP